jgi:hypothetical protein
MRLLDDGAREEAAMRRGEIITAGILALLSMYMMYKSTELEWGYVSGEGPGGGRLAVLAVGDHADLHRVHCN